MSERHGQAGEPRGHVCPQCAAPRALDGTPSCPCGTQVSDALRDARTAQAAAAEDFDPLRIRPFVELEREAARDGQRAPGAAEGGEGVGEAGKESASVRRPEETPTIAMPMAAGTTRPDSADLRLFEEGPAGPATGAGDGATAPPPPGTGPAPDGRGARRSRRGRTMTAAAGAVVTVLVAAGFVSGVFSYDTPERDGALPDDLRASVPDVPPGQEEAAGPEAVPSGSTTPQSPPATTSDAPASPGTSPSTSPSPSGGSASPSRSAEAEEPAGTPTASVTTVEEPAPETADPDDDEPAPRVLRRGDDGPEVTELQLRLRQLGIYYGDIDENFDRGVENAVQHYQFVRGITNDERGVYGLPTRERLESETREP
ncbi:peptidoglycan-binding protein [Streptomyces ruber]|uniref:Peptidoglycan-binding protein n=2 Tax=Streptomyces TaxID=1883 RepID=A0A918ESH0_9ACTN|nr:peptidoglycan-binding domain-containing protein [Streptomyces ruber]GGQ65176.1 peptidoglycan-binding protein [Streptomyces ruber]